MTNVVVLITSLKVAKSLDINSKHFTRKFWQECSNESLMIAKSWHKMRWWGHFDPSIIDKKKFRRFLTLFPRGCQFPPRWGGWGIWYPPLEIKEGVVLVHVAKSYFETYKSYDHILGPYLKNSARYRDLKNLSFWDLVLPWLTEMAITRSIFWDTGLIFWIYSSF